MGGSVVAALTEGGHVWQDGGHHEWCGDLLRELEGKNAKVELWGWCDPHPKGLCKIAQDSAGAEFHVGQQGSK